MWIKQGTLQKWAMDQLPTLRRALYVLLLLSLYVILFNYALVFQSGKTLNLLALQYKRNGIRYSNTTDVLQPYHSSVPYVRLSDAATNIDTSVYSIKRRIRDGSSLTNEKVLRRGTKKNTSISYMANALGWCGHLRSVYPLAFDFTELIDGSISLNIIHEHPFRYLLNPKALCKHDVHTYILSVVKSKITNFKARNYIRATWGKSASTDGNKLVFTIGYSNNRAVQNGIRNEFKKHGDLVQEDFIDSYYNNTLKTCMTIQWTAAFCSNAQFVFMVDDDVAVNFKNLVMFYKNVSENERRTLYSGILYMNKKPHRQVGDPHRISKEEYPYDCYPPFLPGAAILTSGDVIRKFNSILPYVKRYKYDDVYLGILAQKLGIVPKNNDRIAFKTVRHTKLNVQYFIATHGIQNHKAYVMNMYKYK